jgi:Family of unknown function (DUF6221)
MRHTGGMNDLTGFRLTEFLDAQLDEEEKAAQLAARIDDWTDLSLGLEADGIDNIGVALPHIHRHSPARVLAEIGAKRRIIDDYRITDAAIRREGGSDAMHAGRDALLSCIRALAGAYGDHPEARP